MVLMIIMLIMVLLHTFRPVTFPTNSLITIYDCVTHRMARREEGVAKRTLRSHARNRGEF